MLESDKGFLGTAVHRGMEYVIISKNISPYDKRLYLKLDTGSPVTVLSRQLT